MDHAPRCVAELLEVRQHLVSSLSRIWRPMPPVEPSSTQARSSYVWSAVRERCMATSAVPGGKVPTLSGTLLMAQARFALRSAWMFRAARKRRLIFCR